METLHAQMVEKEKTLRDAAEALVSLSQQARAASAARLPAQAIEYQDLEIVDGELKEVTSSSAKRRKRGKPVISRANMLSPPRNIFKGVTRQAFPELRPRKTGKLAAFSVLDAHMQARPSDVGRRVCVLWVRPGAPARPTRKDLEPYYGTVVEHRSTKGSKKTHLVSYSDGSERWHTPADEKGLFRFVKDKK